MDDKSFGGIKPFGKRAVVLFHRDEMDGSLHQCKT